MTVNNFRKFTKKYEKLVSIFGAVGLMAGSVIVLLTTADIIARAVFKQPIKGTFEIVSFMLVILVFFGLGQAQVNKSHVAVDILVNKLPLNVRSVIRSITLFIFLGYVLFLDWQLLEHALEVLYTGDTTAVLGVLISPFILLAALGSIVLSVMVLLDFIKSLVYPEDK